MLLGHFPPLHNFCLHVPLEFAGWMNDSHLKRMTEFGRIAIDEWFVSCQWSKCRPPLQRPCLGQVKRISSPLWRRRGAGFPHLCLVSSGFLINSWLLSGIRITDLCISLFQRRWLLWDGRDSPERLLWIAWLERFVAISWVTRLGLEPF